PGGGGAVPPVRGGAGGGPDGVTKNIRPAGPIRPGRGFFCLPRPPVDKAAGSWYNRRNMLPQCSILAVARGCSFTMPTLQALPSGHGGKTSLDALSLHIRPGEIYGFIGHNGAGKTTTLKSCWGILQFDEGDILVDGVSIRQDPLACKR